MARQTVSIDDLKDRLLAQLDGLVHHFAPPGPGSYTSRGVYFTLNPGRPDRSVGSFCIHMTGAMAGKWRDFSPNASPDRGDVIDLIGLSLGLDSPVAKIKAAREWLGLDTEDPATRRAREEQASRLKAARAAQAQADSRRAEHRRQIARAVWLSGQADIHGTPVDHYLAGRGIDIRALPHLSGAIRFHPECRYYWDEELTDPETGEVSTRTRWRPMPAMVTAIARGREIIDCHRTYLVQGPDGTWTKAPVGDAKKVFGDYSGGSARLCGELGPRGGHLKLRQAAPGAEVWITEGIENGLSLVALRALTGRPPAFVLAAGAIFNFAKVELPEAVTRVVLAADNDSGDQARAALDHAVAAHVARGRAVRVWRSRVPGEDLNDALRRSLREQHEGAA